MTVNAPSCALAEVSDIANWSHLFSTWRSILPATILPSQVGLLTPLILGVLTVFDTGKRGSEATIWAATRTGRRSIVKTFVPWISSERPARE